MFPISLIRHKDPELFFAIVAPVGANVERVCDGLEEALKRFNYKLKTIRVIEQLRQFDGFLDHESGNFDEQLENRMNKGDDFRDLAERDDALAFLAVSSVVRDRAGKSSFYAATAGRLRVERPFAWLRHFRRLVIRWEHHIENFFGMVRLGCTQILLRYL